MDDKTLELWIKQLEKRMDKLEIAIERLTGEINDKLGALTREITEIKGLRERNHVELAGRIREAEQQSKLHRNTVEQRLAGIEEEITSIKKMLYSIIASLVLSVLGILFYLIQTYLTMGVKL